MLFRSAIAGPRILEHMVDVVLYFEGDRQQDYRLLRAVKNRFGSVNELGVFRMTGQGMQVVDNIQVPDLVVEGDADDAELLIVGFGGTYGHLHAAMEELRAQGHKVAQTHFKYINPLPKNTAEVLMKYKKVVVAEQNMGQLVAWLRTKVDGFVPFKYNEVKGQPFVVEELVNAFNEIIK